MNNQTSVGGYGTVRADLTQAVEAKMATMKKDQFQTMTFPMLVSNYKSKNGRRRGGDKKSGLNFSSEIFRCYRLGRLLSFSFLDQDHDISELLHAFAVSSCVVTFDNTGTSCVRFPWSNRTSPTRPTLLLCYPPVQLSHPPNAPLCPFTCLLSQSNYSQLMKILSDESNSMAISWLPHGFSFRIHDRPAFLELLTEYERQFMPGKGSHYSSPGSATKAKKAAQPARTIKWTSLTRKMCRWNILRMAAGPDTGAYFHPKMQRDCPELVNDMVIGSEGATAGDVLKTRSQQPVVAAAAAVAAPVTQFAQAKAHMAAQQQLAQAQAQAQPSPSLLRALNPSAPLSPASHLATLNSLQELVQKSKLAAIRAGPQLGFDAKVIEAELLSQQQAHKGGESTSTTAAAAGAAAAQTNAVPTPAAATPAAPQPPQRLSITQSILAAAGAPAASNSNSNSNSNSATSTPAPIVNNALALSIQQARMENERLRLLSNQIRLGQQRQQQVAAVAAAMATAKADASVPKTDMSGKVVLHSFSNAQA